MAEKIIPAQLKILPCVFLGMLINHEHEGTAGAN